MQDVVQISPSPGRNGSRLLVMRALDYLPRGNMLDEYQWRRRHRLLQWVLLLHVPGLVGLGLLLGHTASYVALVIAPTLACLVVGHLVTHHRLASFFVTGGLVFCSVALVLITRGSIEAHFHFFIIIGFIALYQDWVPFLWNVAFTVLSHGIGTIWLGGQIFNHPAAQQHPWIWSFVHGIAVLFACVGVVIFWRVTEDEQTEKENLGRQLITADAEINRRQFTSDMLVNLARRNQSMLYRQLDIINQLEDKERDPDALADLFKLDHLATRVRRNAESLLVLAGEQAPRTWSAPVALRDVVRAAIAETEDLDRVVFAVDDRVAVSGASVADLTHLMAELTENAVRFSPPETAVTIRARPNRRDEGGQLLTVEDWGVGMPPDDLAEANDLLARPREVDLAVSQRLGFHVVARLAARHGITVNLSATPGSGITAVVALPAVLFTSSASVEVTTPPPGVAAQHHISGRPAELPAGPVRPDDLVAVDEAGPPAPGLAVRRSGDAWLPPEPFTTSAGAGPSAIDERWRGWWNPEVHGVNPGGIGPIGYESAGHPRDGRAGNGHGANGLVSNGNGANGHGPNGHGGNGHGSNSHGPNGHGGNGHGSNGHGSNGHGANGNGNGSNGHGAAGYGRPESEGVRATEPGNGANGHPPIGAPDVAGRRPEGSWPADPLEPPTEGVWLDGVWLDEAWLGGARLDASALDGVQPADGQPATGGTRSANATAPTADGSTGAPAVPEQAPPGDVGVPADGPRIPGVRREPSSNGLGEPVAPGDRKGPRPYPAVPTAMTPPGPRLPQPRADEPASQELSVGRPAAGTTRSRGLRRRVPQSHLAPELRHLAHNGLAETASPLAADTAATALSRYQASRMAAQAVVDVAGESPSSEEGERA